MKNRRLVKGLILLVLCTVFLAVPAGNVYALPFGAAVDYTAGTGPMSVAVGDFDMDGDPDLAVANYDGSNVSILPGVGDGTFGTKVDYATGSIPRSVAVGDFDLDGDPDLAVACSGGTGKVSILLNNGSGGFAAEVPYAAGLAPYSVAVGDFDLDGISDLAVANYGSDNVSILIGTSTGTFNTPAVNYPVGDDPDFVAVGDFNMDGKPDLAVANTNIDNDVSILLGVGDGTFGAKADKAVGWFPGSIAVGDFNGDGKPDLATANRGSKNISILLGNGSGGFATKVDYALGTNPSSIAVGDFNGDGIPDLATANYNANNVSILPGVGNGTFGTKVDYAAGIDPRSVAVGDFDGDGDPDLAVARYNGVFGKVSILLNEPVPIVTVVNPDNGNRGDTLDVTITGTNFTDATEISFGDGITVNGFTENSATQITANITIAADAALGARDVSVTTPAGTGTLTDGFIVTDIPDVKKTYNIKGSIKFFDWTCAKGIVIKEGTLHITEQVGHKVEGYLDIPIEEGPALVPVTPVKGYVGPFVRDDNLKIKNTPRLSLLAKLGEYCDYPDTKYVTYVINGKIKWDKKTDTVKSIKCTINGWGEFGGDDPLNPDFPKQGQFEGKFTATPIP